MKIPKIFLTKKTLVKRLLCKELSFIDKVVLSSLGYGNIDPYNNFNWNISKLNLCNKNQLYNLYREL